MKRAHLLTLGTAALALGVAACSSTNDDTDAGFTPPVDGSGGDGSVGGRDSGGGGAGDGNAPKDGGTTTDHAAPDVVVVMDGGAPGLIINEVCGKGQDFVELYNVGSSSVDLGGWGVTEAKDEDSGAPGSPKTPAVFTGGTTLAAGGYAVVWGAPHDGGTVPACPGGAQCLQATWNVSNKHGASVYLKDPSDATVAVLAYPSGTVGDGQSWGRLPNGTGSFQLNTATPGKANEGP